MGSQGMRIWRAFLVRTFPGLLASVAMGAVPVVRADVVTLKSGLVLQGEIDKDNTILSVYDGLKRIIVRDTKVASIEPSASDRFEAFRVEQPLIKHGGEKPTVALAIKAGEWSDQGRRSFQYDTPIGVN